MNREEKIDAIRKQKLFVPWDAAVFALAAVLIALSFLIAFAYEGREGDTFSVYYDNEVIFTAPLSEDAVYLFEEKDGRGTVTLYAGQETGNYNVIEVKDGKVCVSHSDCPDGICRLRGAVSAGEIVCLPHGFKISVGSEGGSDV